MCGLDRMVGQVVGGLLKLLREVSAFVGGLRPILRLVLNRYVARLAVVNGLLKESVALRGP